MHMHFAIINRYLQFVRFVDRAEKKQWGIKVVTLLPGGFRTNIADNMVASFRDQYDSLPQHLKDEYGEEYFRSRHCYKS